MKSLDDLIRFLLEEIALCGNQGAPPSKILQSIEAFYKDSSQKEGTPEIAINIDNRSAKSVLIDRPFQEQVWQWLVKNPDCRVGLDGRGNSLTLSEVEAANSIPSEQKILVNEKVPSELPVSSYSQESQTLAEGMNNALPKELASSASAQLQQEARVGDEEPNPSQKLRLYTSDDRMWRTLTGHGVDFSKMPHSEFVCLSIIAAQGSRGITQPSLVRISGQDKRSVPQRTQRLCESGHIIKRPILAEGSRTSICFFKRFVSESTPSDTDLVQSIGPRSESILNPCFRNSETDVYALSRIIFDILKDRKIITRRDLKARLGVTQIPRARLIFSKTLRKLMALGCLKEVKALDNTPRPILKYFLCVKLVREPGEQECRKIFGKGYGKMFLENTEGEADVDSEDDDIDDGQVEELTEGPSEITLQEVERAIPQWTGTGCVYNFLHNLIQNSGTQGMMTKDIKSQAFGKAMMRPVDSQLARLTKCWQISQPLHLRHLAIVRDIEMTHRTSHFVHYTYDNFKKLVESGKASWEAVVTIAANDKRAQKYSVAQDADPTLDEFGFPSLETTLFQDRENVATLAECNRALNIAQITHFRDWVAKKRADGTYGLEYVGGKGESRSRRPPGSVAIGKNVQPKVPKVPKGPKGPKGRPRKIPISGLPQGVNSKQMQKFRASQRMAAKYQKKKAENEIERRVGDGEDPLSVKEDVFAKLTARYVDAGEEVPPLIKDMIDQEDSGEESLKPKSPASPAAIDADARPIMDSPQSDSTNPICEAEKTSGSAGPSQSHQKLRQVSISPPSGISGQKRKRSEFDALVSFEYFPSIHSHTRPNLNEPGLFLARADENSATIPFPPSKKQRGPVLARNNQQADISISGNSVYLKERNYKEQAKLIKRIGPGVFVGEKAAGPRKQGQRGRTKYSRLAVFKSARLSDFTWFVKEVATAEDGASYDATSSEMPFVPRPKLPATVDSHIAHKPRYDPLSRTATLRKLKAPTTSLHLPAAGSEHGLKNSSDPPKIIEDTNAPENPPPVPNCSAPPKILEDTHAPETPPAVPNCSAPSNILEDAHAPENPPAVPNCSDPAKILEATPAPENPLGGSPSVNICEHIRASSATQMLANSLTPNPAVSAKPIRTTQKLPDFITSVGTARGSLGFLRRKIIMDIIERCGGVHPGARELLPPFTTAWTKLEKYGKPDARTVQAAYNYLVQTGKLRQISFSFRCAKGSMVTKKMATLIDISPTDQKVKDMQRHIEDSWPSMYLPPGAEYTEESRTDQSYVAVYGRQRNVEYELEEQVQLEHKCGFDIRYEEQQARNEMKPKAPKSKKKERRATGAKTGLLGYYSRRDVPGSQQLTSVAPARKIERLIRRPEESTHGLVTAPLIPGSDPATLTGAGAAESIGDADLASMEFKRWRLLHTGAQRNSTAITYRGALRNEYSEVEKMSFSAGKVAHGQVHKDTHRALNPNITLNGSGTAHETNNNFHDKNLLDIEASGPMRLSRAQEKVGEVAVDEDILSLNGDHLRRNCPRLEMVNSMMNPVHDFHQSTGTFSIDFSGFQIRRLYSNDTPTTGSFREAESDFMDEVNDVLAWELKTENLPHIVFRDWPFVNHRLKHPHQLPSDVHYEVSKSFEVYFSSAATGLKKYRPRFAPHMPKPRVADRHSTREPEHVRPAGSLATSPLVSPAATGKSLKRKRPATTTRQLTSQAEKQKLIYIDGKPNKVRRIRGPHVENPLSIEEEKRLLVAVTVIRTLTGGIDRNIDWVRISRLFQPKYSQFYIQKRWGHVLHRYRLQVDQIQVKFQDHFTKAYEDGTVPPINYDNLEAYDWAWLVDWTLENIETSRDNLPYLPATRAELDCFFDLQEAGDEDMAEYYEIDGTSVAQRREILANRKANVYPADKKRPAAPDPVSDNMALAKTWIRANVITPQADYNSELARAKLAPIGESAITVALQELLAAKVISAQNKGRLLPGRNYDISDHFINRLRKKLEAAHFHQAVAHKRRMDAEFWKSDRVIFSIFASNGDVIAVLNMLAHQRIMVKPNNPPMNKYGFTDGTYQTRRMDKARLNFDVEIRLRPTYISGNPLLPLPPIPCAHLGDPKAKIPVWYDIHGKLIPIMWEFALSAVLTILCKRPGVPTNSLLASLKPSIEPWELHSILEWTVRAKATRKTGCDSYALEEWWWMCLGDESRVEGA